MNINEYYENSISDELKKYNYSFCKIDDPKILNLVYNLFIHQKIVDNINDALYLLYRGCYEKLIKRDNNLAEKCYLMAADLGNPTAMYNLASLYEKQQKYDLESLQLPVGSRRQRPCCLFYWLAVIRWPNWDVGKLRDNQRCSATAAIP